MKKNLLFVLVMLMTLSGVAQDSKQEKKFGIKFKGYVKNDFFWDSRQSTSAREGHFMFWPNKIEEDANGTDINDVTSFNFLSIQSRLSGVITGPEVLGAKSSGLIEGDFFAQANDNINLFRLRHAFVKLQWKNTQLLMGQYWNPLFITDCFPSTVSFNTGAPISPFARNPQIRLTQNAGNFKFILAALGQRDYPTRGVAGPSSSYLRNSGIPDMHAQIHFSLKKENTKLVTGVGFEYKTVRPRITSTVLTVAQDPSTAVNYKVDEKLSSMAAVAFIKLETKPITCKVEGIYGENIADVLSISGFAVKEIVDPLTGEQAYTPLTNAAVWTDIQTNGKKFQAGIFAGYSQNLGTKEELSSSANDVYGLGKDVQSLLRVSPRVVYNVGKLRFGAEVEFTQAEYPEQGATLDSNYLASDTYKVSNTRVLVSSFYFF